MHIFPGSEPIGKGFQLPLILVINLVSIVIIYTFISFKSHPLKCKSKVHSQPLNFSYYFLPPLSVNDLLSPPSYASTVLFGYCDYPHMTTLIFTYSHPHCWTTTHILTTLIFTSNYPHCWTTTHILTIPTPLNFSYLLTLSLSSVNDLLSPPSYPTNASCSPLFEAEV